MLCRETHGQRFAYRFFRLLLLLASTLIVWWPSMAAADAGSPPGIGPDSHRVISCQNRQLTWSPKEFLANLAKVETGIRANIARQPDLHHCRDRLSMKLDGTGLHIKLRGTPGPAGSAGANYPSPTRHILEIIARELGRLPSHLIDVQVRQGSSGEMDRSRNATHGSSRHPSVSVGSNRLETLIRASAYRQGVDPELVKAVVRHESGFNPRAVSPKGAEGLMQLMPATAAFMGVKDTFDPKQNLAGGIRYLRLCLDRFGHNVPLAVAAYNAGPAQVARYGGIPPFGETRCFVQAVMQSYGLHNRDRMKSARDFPMAGGGEVTHYPLPTTPGGQIRPTSQALDPFTVIEVRPRKN
jgi:hypothetical protein